MWGVLLGVVYLIQIIYRLFCWVYHMDFSLLLGHSTNGRVFPVLMDWRLCNGILAIELCVTRCGKLTQCQPSIHQRLGRVHHPKNSVMKWDFQVPKPSKPRNLLRDSALIFISLPPTKLAYSATHVVMYGRWFAEPSKKLPIKLVVCVPQ